jgi:polyisoprenoid-binding protein YceI
MTRSGQAQSGQAQSGQAQSGQAQSGQAQSGQLTDQGLRARLADGSLAGPWTLDPARSTVHLRSKTMWGLVPVKGAFGQVSGEGVVAADGDVSGTLTVASASIDTRVKKRDEHLRSADLFDSATYPHFTFTAERLTLTSDAATVAGTLQVRDRTRPLTFPATVTESADGTVQINAQVAIDRSDFGLTWNQLGMASMKNTLTISAAFTRG